MSSGQREIAGIRSRVERLLANASDGVQKTFIIEVDISREWLSNLKGSSISGMRFKLRDLPSYLTTWERRLQKVLDEGRDAENKLTNALTIGVDKMKGNLIARLTQLDGARQSSDELFANWLEHDESEPIDRGIVRARELIDVEEFSMATQALDQLADRLQKSVATATAREAKHLQQQAACELAAARRQITACRLSLSKMLDQASPGLIDTFTKEVHATQNWLTQQQQLWDGLVNVTDESGVETINTAAERLKELANHGNDVIHTLNATFFQRAAELRDKAESSISKVEIKLEGGRKLLHTWCEGSELAQFDREIARLRAALREERLLQIDTPVRALDVELTLRLAFASEQSEKHGNRKYVVEAVAQVCGERGFDVVELRYEREEDQSSRIVLKVDTKNRGLIQFYFTLDSKIDADFPMDENHCYHDADDISKALEANFGVQASFRMSDGTWPLLPDSDNQLSFEDEDDNHLEQSGQA